MTYKLLNGIFSLTTLTISKELQYTVAVLLLFIIYTFLAHYYYKKRLHRLLTQQQQALKNERQRISSEIHDDIGAGFFAIKLFADLVSKNGRQNDEIMQLSSMINELSEKIKEIIWSTNYENDNLENLIYYLEFQTTKLFDHSQTIFRVQVPDQIPEKTISSEVRKNIYLIVKEFIHNAIRHGHALHIALEIYLLAEGLRIVIVDDGTGFDQSLIKKNSMGLKNVKARLEKLDGTVLIDSVLGTKITITIPLA